MCYSFYYYELLLSEAPNRATQDIAMLRRTKGRYSDAHSFYLDTRPQSHWQPHYYKELRHAN